jgi:hypothetical protein
MNEDFPHGHEFNLFTFRYMRDECIDMSFFEIVGWDEGDPHSASLFGLTYNKENSYFEISILFMNFMFDLEQ